VKKKALFLDRDGVINVDVKYPHKPEHITFTDGIFDLCRLAQEKEYLLVVVTNQAGVAKGYFTEDDVRKLHAWMAEQFRLKSIEITAFYFCPFHKDGVVEEYCKESDCRKPNPGMLLQAAKEHSINLRKSFIVGDKQSDRIRLPQLRSIILKSSYSGDDYDVESLAEIAQFL
jgi:D-glycero-D-manno-heptose 1,7-bisphosphate phosphatase